MVDLIEMKYMHSWLLLVHQHNGFCTIPNICQCYYVSKLSVGPMVIAELPKHASTKLMWEHTHVAAVKLYAHMNQHTLL